MYNSNIGLTRVVKCFDSQREATISSCWNRLSVSKNILSVSVGYRILFIIVVAAMLTTAAHAQIRCATQILEKKALLKNPQQRIQFEAWMKKKLAEKSAVDHSRAKTNASYQIPIVVHILHNGESIGVGQNIPDAQVHSQIRVLNEDYKRLNDDAIKTPAEFAPVASSIDIEFVLAKQDPEGLPTTGITRRLASQPGGYTVDEDAEIKAHDYWPSEDYLNIWIVNLTDEFLGLSQYPEGSGLSGLTAPYDRLSDGVIIHYTAFGSLDDGAFGLSDKYYLGRTTTHEIGHYFGLLHTFGEGNGCSSTDFVSDTPIQAQETLNCPIIPVSQCPDNHHIMYQNYMDYTDDECMNLFTTGQVARIQAVLDNSPRRKSLLISHGLVDPVVHNFDLEAKNVEAPFALTCGQSIVPRVVLRNRGTTTITSARIDLILNGSIVETKDFSLNLVNLATTTLSFNTINLLEPSSNNVSFTITQVNGIADDEPNNNTATITSNVVARTNTPYFQAFNTTPADWQIINTDLGTTWTNITAPKANPANKAMYVNFYEYQRLEEKDLLISPFMIIPALDNSILKFDHAYAVFQSVNTESLRVLVSSGCSADLSTAVEIYNKSGNALSTAPNQSTPFTPNGEARWTTDGIALGAFKGQTVRFIFESTNQNGNNLYLDNMQVNSGQNDDLKLVSVLSPGPVFCETKPKPVITVQNFGTDAVSKLTIVTEVNGVPNSSETRNGLDLTPGTSIDLTLGALNLSQPNNVLKITVSNPDVGGDDAPTDNSITLTRILNTAHENIPLRQNFDNNVANWSIYSDGDQKKWEGTSTSSYQNSLIYKAFSNLNIGEESWFVSPVLNMSRTNQGSMFFSTSYGRRPTGNETLRVLVSEDCGLTYDHMIYEKTGQDLANETSVVEWTPANQDDWVSNYISINDFAGKDNIRVAFVTQNGNGNNLFLDNIEFFIEDNPNPPRPEELIYVRNSDTDPYKFFVTFNLPEKQDARLLVYNTMGQVLIDSQLTDALNQTYAVDLYGQSSGVYIARLLTASQNSTAKLFVGH